MTYDTGTSCCGSGGRDQSLQAVQRCAVAHLAGGVIDKEDKSPVTVADFGAQACSGASILAAVFPQEPLVGEEDSALLHRP